MTGDPLNDPLGQELASTPSRGAGSRTPWVVASLICFAAAGGALAIARRPQSGSQVAVAPITVVEPSRQIAPQPSAAASASNGTLTADEVDRQSGVKITRPEGSPAGLATIIQVPQDLTVSLQRAPDPRLAEQSRYGLLPKRGRDGTRALDVYARPLVTDTGLPPNAPRIALVVGGMGLNAPLTAAAAAELPAAVTLAFAPYGEVLDTQVQSARDAGHEAILQVPMESVGNVSASSMPHLLMTGDDARETIDRLHWHMARFTGYVGVTNFLGGSFTAEAAALGPVLAEVAQRGLLYFDDGTAARSLATNLAPDTGLPLVRADIVVDGTGSGPAIDLALSKLESRARDRGFAVGFASALPVSVHRVAAFARGLAARGIALVPVSALATALASPSRAASKP